MASMKDLREGKVLGKLELAVMEIVWQSSKPIFVREVANSLQSSHPVAYTTVLTIMSRLSQKGLLKRKALGKAFIYKANYSKETFLARISRQIIDNLLNSFGESAVANFAQELGRVPLTQKRKLIKILKSSK